MQCSFSAHSMQLVPFLTAANAPPAKLFTLFLSHDSEWILQKSRRNSFMWVKSMAKARWKSSNFIPLSVGDFQVLSSRKKVISNKTVSANPSPYPLSYESNFIQISILVRAFLTPKLDVRRYAEASLDLDLWLACLGYCISSKTQQRWK